MVRQALCVVVTVLAGVTAALTDRPPTAAPAPHPLTSEVMIDLRLELLQCRSREKDAILVQLIGGEIRLVDAVRACEQVDTRWSLPGPRVKVAAPGRSHGERLANALAFTAIFQTDDDSPSNDDSRCELAARLAVELEATVASGELLAVTGPGD